MGTRNLTAAYLGGKYKIAQYGQWDGYPEGQGIGTLHFVRDKMNETLFREKLKYVSFIEPQELTDLWKQYGADADGMVSMKDADRMKEDFPQFSRDTGSDIFGIVQNSPSGIKLQDSLCFVADSLFCEWAWVIDLDKRMFEAYQGFQKLPLNENERFSFLEKNSDGEYHPCRMIAAWSFDNLPTDEEFIAAFEREESEDDD